MSYNVLSKQIVPLISASFTGSFAGTGGGLTNITASFINGGSTGYVTLWNTDSSLTSSVLFQSSSNVTANVNNFFLIKNSTTSLNVSNGVQVTSSAAVPLQINNATSQSLLQVSQSGVITLATQSIALTGSIPAGSIYFTSASFYVGLEG